MCTAPPSSSCSRVQRVFCGFRPSYKSPPPHTSVHVLLVSINSGLHWRSLVYGCAVRSSTWLLFRTNGCLTPRFRSVDVDLGFTRCSLRGRDVVMVISNVFYASEDETTPRSSLHAKTMTVCPHMPPQGASGCRNTWLPVYRLPERESPRGCGYL